MVRCTRERPPHLATLVTLLEQLRYCSWTVTDKSHPAQNPTAFSLTLREFPTERRFEVQLGRRAFFRCSLARDQRQTTAAFIDWCCWLAAPAPDSTAAAATTTTRRLLLLERLAAESDLVVVSGCFFWFRKVGISIGRQGRLRRCDAWLLVHGSLAGAADDAVSQSTSVGEKCVFGFRGCIHVVAQCSARTFAPLFSPSMLFRTEALDRAKIIKGIIRYVATLSEGNEQYIEH